MDHFGGGGVDLSWIIPAWARRIQEHPCSAEAFLSGFHRHCFPSSTLRGQQSCPALQQQRTPPDGNGNTSGTLPAVLPQGLRAARSSITLSSLPPAPLLSGAAQTGSPIPSLWQNLEVTDVWMRAGCEGLTVGDGRSRSGLHESSCSDLQRGAGLCSAASLVPFFYLPLPRYLSKARKKCATMLMDLSSDSQIRPCFCIRFTVFFVSLLWHHVIH